jgi:hypothetical protein
MDGEDRVVQVVLLVEQGRELEGIELLEETLSGGGRLLLRLIPLALAEGKEHSEVLPGLVDLLILVDQTFQHPEVLQELARVLGLVPETGSGDLLLLGLDFLFLAGQVKGSSATPSGARRPHPPSSANRSP